MDRESNRSRGTGFVCFRDREDADQCLNEAQQTNACVVTAEQASSGKKTKRAAIYSSVLTADPTDSLAARFTLRGRVLFVMRAVEREQARKLTEDHRAKRRREDRRNLYLMREGVIFPDTPAASGLTPAEVSKRLTSYSNRKALLGKNPSLYISKTRLTIRNLPVSVDEKRLKQLACESIERFKEKVKQSERDMLTKDEMAEGWQHKPVLKQAKVIRAKDRIDAKSLKNRSKGYGFIEFTHHAHALAALRHLNNNPDLFGEKKRPIVEFAIENATIVRSRSQRRLSQLSKKKVRGNDDEDGAEKHEEVGLLSLTDKRKAAHQPNSIRPAKKARVSPKAKRKNAVMLKSKQ